MNRWDQARHLLSMEALTRPDIEALLDATERHLAAKSKSQPLAGTTIIQLFLEPSTRTRASFETAARRLGATILNVTGSTSSTTKGETLLDTVRNLEAMGPTMLILRHSASGAAEFVARHSRLTVINAGDGTHEHPTQALLDCATLRHHKKKLTGLIVVICGDITHSRVARSNLWALSKLGAQVRIVGPATLIPRGIEEIGGQIFTDFDAACEGADAVMMLRIQEERLAKAKLFPSLMDYCAGYQLTGERLARLKPDAIVMHPGPMIRGLELSSEIADGPRSVILSQVAIGVAARMAVLEHYAKLSTAA